MALEPNRPPCGVAFEKSLLKELGFEPKRLGNGVLKVSLLGDMSLEPEKIPPVNEGLVDPNKLLCEGDWVDSFLPKSAIVGYFKGFTAQECVLNSSSRFLLFVSGSR